MWPFRKTLKAKAPQPASLFGIYNKPVEYERAEIEAEVFIVCEYPPHFVIPCTRLPILLRPNAKVGDKFKMIVMVEKESDNAKGTDYR